MHNFLTKGYTINIQNCPVVGSQVCRNFAKKQTNKQTNSWRVTTYVGKPSAIGQQTKPTQPFILSGSING